MKKFTKQDIINFKMKKLNYLKNISFKRSFNDERLLDKIEIMECMKGQIYNGHVIEIAAFALLGVYKRYTDDYFYIRTSLLQDKKHADVSIKTEFDGDIKYIDIKSGFSYQVNPFIHKDNVAILNYDETGSVALFNILDHVGISESKIRKDFGKLKYYRMIKELDNTWDYFINEFHLC